MDMVDDGSLDTRLDIRREAILHPVDELKCVPRSPNVRTRALNREGVLNGLPM
jgi:hypothetical protein